MKRCSTELVDLTRVGFVRAQLNDEKNTKKPTETFTWIGSQSTGKIYVARYILKEQSAGDRRIPGP